MQNCNPDQDNDCFTKVKKDIHNADAFRLRPCTDGTDDSRSYTVSQINADDDSIDCLECQHTACRKCLQDTDGGRRAL